MKKLFLALAAICTMFSTSAMAVERFQEGTQYIPIVPAQKNNAPEGKVEVIEFFWYGCPHCYEFEPALNQWLKNKPDNVVFKRIPAVFNKAWVIHAKAYLAAEMLGITDKVHGAIFKTIHSRNPTERKPLDTADSIAAFMAEKSGLEKKVVLDTINSFAVESQSRKAIQASRLYGIRGVPSVAIGGKYLTSGRYAGNYETMTEVMTFLANKEAK